MIAHPTQKSALRVCSLNVNHSNVATHTTMHHISTQKDPPFNIILVQEPLWGKINSSHTTVSLARWQVTLLKPTIVQNECPRMVSYHRLGTGINLMLRTDIAQDLDYMIMNVGREGAAWPQTILINIYNQKAQDTNNGITQEWTSDHLQSHIPIQSIPMIIAGDWNIRDPSWDDRVPAPNL